MMLELGLAVSSASVAKRYGGLLDGYIVDQGDTEDIPRKVHVAPTLMTSVADKEALARTTLAFADSLA